MLVIPAFPKGKPAVIDLENIKKDKNKKILKDSSNKFDNSNIPKNTLKLIEEAEKTKN